jgi:hypothetical protein
MADTPIKADPTMSEASISRSDPPGISLSDAPAVVTPPASPATTKQQVRVKRAYRKKKKPHSGNTAKRMLAEDFQPTEFSVICGRGKECFESEGVSFKNMRR